MINHNHYVPVLKWKMGEYQALSRLDPRTQSRTIPLLEITPPGFDFEQGKMRKEADEHLADFGKRLKSKWQDRPCFIDIKHLLTRSTSAGGKHVHQFLFDQARAEGCSAVPVVRLDSDKSEIRSIVRAAREDGRGIGLRIFRSDFDRDSIAEEIDRRVQEADSSYGETDLILDMGAPNYIPIKIFVKTLHTVIYDIIPSPNKWRSLIVIGSSYPASVAALDTKEVPRQEWIAYKRFVSSLAGSERIPAFGDFAAATPDLVELDMRLIKPLAKMRYTADDIWYIAVGKNVRANGFEQYRELCREIVRQKFFSGPSFSEADKYIDDCAKGKASTGNLSTWVWVGTNRHITKVVHDLSSLFSS